MTQWFLYYSIYFSALFAILTTCHLHAYSAIVFLLRANIPYNDCTQLIEYLKVVAPNRLCLLLSVFNALFWELRLLNEQVQQLIEKWREIYLIFRLIFKMIWFSILKEPVITQSFEYEKNWVERYGINVHIVVLKVRNPNRNKIPQLILLSASNNIQSHFTQNHINHTLKFRIRSS